MAKVSFVIPVKDNAATLRGVVESIAEVMAGFSELTYEVVFVNDGSEDGSLQIIKGLAAKDPNVQFISFTRGFGQVQAIIAGWHKASGDAVIIRSADDQDPVDLLGQLISDWMKGSKVVIAHRQSRSDSLSNRLVSKLFYSTISVVIPNMPKGGFDHCLLDREVIEQLKKIKHRNRFLQGDILSLGYPVKLIPYERTEDRTAPDRKGSSFASKLKYSIDAVVNTTYLPIRLMSLFGALSMLAGLVYSVVIVVARITGNVPFEGWAPLMILLLLIGGMIMLMLGIMGEYIWRIHDQLKDRPDYLIKEESD